MKLIALGRNYLVLSLRRQWRTNGYTCAAFVRIEWDEHGCVTCCTLCDPYPSGNNGPGEGVAISMLVDDLATQIRAILTVLRYLGVGVRHWVEDDIQWVERYTHHRASLTRLVELNWDRTASRYRFPPMKETVCALY